MTASDYILDLRQRGFMVFASERGLYVIPKRDLSEQDRATIRARKWELLATVRDEENKNLIDNMVEMSKRLGEKLAQTKNELTYAECRIELLKMENQWLRQDALRPKPAYELLDERTITEAIGITHPDKNGNSEVSNRVTAALIKARDQLRRARQ